MVQSKKIFTKILLFVHNYSNIEIVQNSKLKPISLSLKLHWDLPFLKDNIGQSLWIYCFMSELFSSIIEKQLFTYHWADLNLAWKITVFSNYRLLSLSTIFFIAYRILFSQYLHSLITDWELVFVLAIILKIWVKHSLLLQISFSSFSAYFLHIRNTVELFILRHCYWIYENLNYIIEPLLGIIYWTFILCFDLIF